jgi:signal peptidase II
VWNIRFELRVTQAMSRHLHAILLLLLAGMVGCDHATKQAAVVHLAGERVVEIIPGVLDLRYTQNHDIAFRLLSWFDGPAKLPVLVVTPSIALVALAMVWWRRRHAPRLEQAAYALLISGAVGNLIDRVARGFVVDFIHLHHWPVFNVADSAVVVGALLLAISSGLLRNPSSKDLPASPPT